MCGVCATPRPDITSYRWQAFTSVASPSTCNFATSCLSGQSISPNNPWGTGTPPTTTRTIYRKGIYTTIVSSAQILEVWTRPNQGQPIPWIDVPGVTTTAPQPKPSPLEIPSPEWLPSVIPALPPLSPPPAAAPRAPPYAFVKPLRDPAVMPEWWREVGPKSPYRADPREHPNADPRKRRWRRVRVSPRPDALPGPEVFPEPSPGAPAPGPSPSPRPGPEPMPRPQPVPQPRPVPQPEPYTPPIDLEEADASPNPDGGWDRRPPTHRQTRPPKRVRERKLILRTGLGKIYGGITEAVDAIDAVYYAIPARYRRNERTPQAKLAAIYRNVDRLDYDKALRDYLVAQAIDMVVGKTNRLVNDAYFKAYMKTGQIGPAVGPGYGPGIGGTTYGVSTPSPRF